MNQSHYEVRTTSDRLQFEFISEGPKGQIVKRIEYTYIEDLDFWNMGFGDYNVDTGHLDDRIISDNGDGRKILATVAFSLREFLAIRPDATVFFTGSTNQRTQVYNWAITKYWSDISTDFRVYGVAEAGDAVPFVPRQNYIGFLVYKA